ncbi:MAG TPA: hypothetical protein VFZ48_02195 [Candidatus Saccharimonadales bacterium]
MFCIKCHAQTLTSNSRPHKKTPQVWRRRTCKSCGYTFTTYERISLPDELIVKGSKEDRAYNPAQLLQSIVECFAHTADATQHAYWLLRTIEDSLAANHTPAIQVGHLKQMVYTTLSGFDDLAGVQYAARHNLKEILRKQQR